MKKGGPEGPPLGSRRRAVQRGLSATRIAPAPPLCGLEKPAQIVQLGASVGDLVNMAVLAAHEANIAARK